MTNVTTTRMRVRVRPLGQVPVEQRRATAKQHCLSVPHMGEAVAGAADAYRLLEAARGEAWHRELHYGHQLGSGCHTAPDELGGRCLYIDYVEESAEKDQDELDVAGLVAKAKL